MVLLGEIAALSASLFWAGNSIALTEATVRIGSIAVNIIRMILASFYLLITILIFGFSFDISTSQYFYLISSGIIGLIIGDTALFKSFHLIGARIGMLLMSLAPPVSALLAYFLLDETLTMSGIFGIAVTLGGVTIVILSGKSSKKIKFNLVGISLGLLAAICQAVGLILVKQAFNESALNEFVVSFIRIFSAVVIMYFAARITGNITNPYRKLIQDKQVFKFLIAASILGPFLGITAAMIAVANTNVGIASTLMATVPIVMLPMVKIYYREKLGVLAIVGAFVAVAGVALIFLG